MASDSFLAYAVSCSLVDLLDQPLLVQLRDGRKLIGTLMSARCTHHCHCRFHHHCHHRC